MVTARVTGDFCRLPASNDIPVKPLGQMIWNLVRSIYARSSIEITHFVLIHLQTWLLQAIPVLDWSISKNVLIWNCFAKMNRYLVGSTYGRLCIKFPQSRMKGERHRLTELLVQLELVSGLALDWLNNTPWRCKKS